MAPPSTEITPLLNQQTITPPSNNLMNKIKKYFWETLYAIADFDLWTIYLGLTALKLNIALGGNVIFLSMLATIFAGPIAMAVSVGFLTLLIIKNMDAIIHRKESDKNHNHTLLPCILDTTSLGLAVIACSFLATSLIPAISFFASLTAVIIAVPALFIASFLANAYSCYKKIQNLELTEETRASYKRQMIAGITVSGGIVLGLLMPTVLTISHISLATILPSSMILIATAIPPLTLLISLIAVAVLAINRNPPFNKAWQTVKSCWKKLLSCDKENQSHNQADLFPQCPKANDSFLPQDVATTLSIQTTESHPTTIPPQSTAQTNTPSHNTYASLFAHNNTQEKDGIESRQETLHLPKNFKI